MSPAGAGGQVGRTGALHPPDRRILEPLPSSAGRARNSRALELVAMREVQPAPTSIDGETFLWNAKGSGNDAAPTYAHGVGVRDATGAVDR